MPKPQVFGNNITNFLNNPAYNVSWTNWVSIKSAIVYARTVYAEFVFDDGTTLKLPYAVVGALTPTTCHVISGCPAPRYGIINVDEPIVGADDRIIVAAKFSTDVETRVPSSETTYYLDFYARNLEVSVYVGKLRVTVVCSGSDLEQGTCLAYCTDIQSAVADTCYDAARSFCFPDASFMPVGVSKFCQDYFARWIAENSPNTQLDADFSRYCQPYAGNMGLLINAKTSRTEKDLCACHLSPDPEIYDKYYHQLLGDYQLPASSAPEPCYLPDCASSPYKSTRTGKVCEAPACLNVANFDAEGNVVVNVDQQIQCGLSGTGCKSDADCPGGLRCAANGSCTTVCNNDGECSAGVCVDQHCVACRADGDCPTAGDVCRDNHCYAACPEGICPAGVVCRDGACVPGCAADADCAPLFCLRGQCSADECAADSDCAGGAKCQGGRCVAPAPPCASNADCLAGFECSSGTCVEKKGLTPWVWVLIGLGSLILVIALVIGVAALARKKK
jgi:hypothetical protein